MVAASLLCGLLKWKYCRININLEQVRLSASWAHNILNTEPCCFVQLWILKPQENYNLINFKSTFLCWESRYFFIATEAIYFEPRREISLLSSECLLGLWWVYLLLHKEKFGPSSKWFQDICTVRRKRFLWLKFYISKKSTGYNEPDQYAAYMNKYLNQWDALLWYNILNILKITIKSVMYLIILVLMFRFSIVTPYTNVFFQLNWESNVASLTL